MFRNRRVERNKNYFVSNSQLKFFNEKKTNYIPINDYEDLESDYNSRNKNSSFKFVKLTENPDFISKYTSNSSKKYNDRSSYHNNDYNNDYVSSDIKNTYKNTKDKKFSYSFNKSNLYKEKKQNSFLDEPKEFSYTIANTTNKKQVNSKEDFENSYKTNSESYDRKEKNIEFKQEKTNKEFSNNQLKHLNFNEDARNSILSGYSRVNEAKRVINGKLHYVRIGTPSPFIQSILQERETSFFSNHFSRRFSQDLSFKNKLFNAHRTNNFNKSLNNNLLSSNRFIPNFGKKFK